MLQSVHRFELAEGVAIPTSIVEGRDGALYGTALYPNYAALFRFDPRNGQLRAVPLAQSQAPTEPRNPMARLVQAIDGSFYGTTEEGGAFGFGTIFRWALPDTVTVIHSFSGGSGGAKPASSLVEAPDGSLLGTSSAAGACSQTGGTIFRITPAGAFSTLHTFGCGVDGANPLGPLVPAGDGSYWGTTWRGGRVDGGVVYRLSPSGVVSVVHDFTAADAVTNPFAVTLGSNGLWYGTSAGGLFAMTTRGDLVFTVNQDGWSRAPLLLAADGNLYGASSRPPSARNTLFRLTPAGRLVTLARTADASFAAGGLTQARDRSIYAVQTAGGEVFRLLKVSGGDFTGDGTSDVSVYRHGSPVPGAPDASGLWFSRPSEGTPPQGIAWGAFGDMPVPGDYDGDGITDAAIFRPSTNTWWIRYGRDASFESVVMGDPGDRPVPADYDGDGKTNVAVFTPSTGLWRALTTTYANPIRELYWGNSADVPVPGDYNGDGYIDAAVYRPSEGTWYLNRWWGAGAAIGVAWGNADDVPVPGDYDGDFTTDIAVFRPSDGVWYVVPSSTGVPYGVAWGNSADIPVPGDYDGDERTDIAVFRPSNGTWYIRYASGAATGV